MGSLKIKHKLMLGSLGQLTFIGLILFFIFNLLSKLNEVTEHKVKSTQRVNSLEKLTFVTKDYFADNIGFEELKSIFEKNMKNDMDVQVQKEVQNNWSMLNQVEALKDSNNIIEEKVMETTTFSIEQSNAFINAMSQKLADAQKRKEVSVIERMVIAGANANNNNNFSTQLLFQKMKKNIDAKENLLSFLDQSIEQTKKDIKLLKNTPFAELPVKANNANIKIKKLTKQFIKNTEEKEKLEQEILFASNNLIDQLNNEDIETTKQSFASIKRSILSIFFILLLTSLALIILNTSLSGLLKTVFTRLPDDLRALSEGDLTRKPPKGFEKRNDELGDLVRAYNLMVDKIKSIITEIKQGANYISTASQQLSATSEQLSQGANNQASSAEEVSSTMEEISSNISQNTDNAEQTEKISLSAQRNIKNVHERVGNAMEANMVIADKITIINDIAFQTNLLALNAAVEAARAGDHGKGFAVVASEVRKLAERSKKAADEIVVLAKNSLELSEGAGDSMSQIIPEIEKTTKLVQEITAASIEQNNGANQINAAIQTLSQVTQQNASVSEEMASSSIELSSQAENLNGTVSYFKIDQWEINNMQGRKNKMSFSKPLLNEKAKLNNNTTIQNEAIADNQNDEEFEKF